MSKDTDMELKLHHSLYTDYLKRMIDFSVCALVLLLLSPLFLVLMILEYIFHGRPVFYGSKRPGKNGEIFSIYKFRSMTNEKDQFGNLLPDEKRLTKFGIFLRRLSLDELPQLLNIVKGDMAIIGPRPLMIEYLPLYGERYAKRHLVRPGLACPRIMASDSPWSWREQFENDLYYVEHVSFLLDMRLIWLTLMTAVQGSDTRTFAERPAFNGENWDAF